MKKLNITEGELLTKYIISLETLLDECDWVTYVPSQMICGLIVSVLLENNVNVFMSSEELYDIYLGKVRELNLSDEEWAKSYDIPKIINMIYSILETKAE
jgi:hypothetical protein